MATSRKRVVGVVKGRWQTYELHPGHEYTLKEAMRRHKKVLLLVGTRWGSTTHDPMPFPLVKMMLEGKYKGITVVEEQSSPRSYVKRSGQLDALMEAAYPDCYFIIYGARDSIVHTYRGKYPVVETKTLPQKYNATAMRENIPYTDSVDFRKGYIRAVMDQPARWYPTVDVVVVSPDGQVLLIGLEEEEGKLRFPGVFFNPELDKNLEAAAERCIAKELPGAVVGEPVIIGSTKIDDWRYRQTRDGIITLLMKVWYEEKGNPRPGAGIKRIKWVDTHQVPRVICKTHKPLVQMMKYKW